LGDCYLAVEFGDEANLLLSFRTLMLLELLVEQQITGVIEVCPTIRELGIVYDRTLTTYARVESIVDELLDHLGERDTLHSRHITIPVWYDDPWSAEVAERYGVPNNIRHVAAQNSITTEQLIERHTGSDFWVVLVGFTPGCNLHYALDPAMALTASKYYRPRTFTPERGVGMAGLGTCLYPVASPGGYQLVGRAAIGIYDPVARNPAFPEDGVLIRAGDRIRYRSVGPLEYDEMWSEYCAGRWEFEVNEELFSVSQYESRMKATTEVAP
jgi:urea carboxylase